MKKFVLLLIILVGASPSFSASVAVEDAEAKAIHRLETSLSQQDASLSRQELWKIYDISMGEKGLGKRAARPGKERQTLIHAAMLRPILMPNPRSTDIFPQVSITFVPQDKVVNHYVNMRIISALFQDNLLKNEQATSCLVAELTKRFENLSIDTIRSKIVRFSKDQDFQAVLRNKGDILAVRYQAQETDIKTYKNVAGEVNYLLPMPQELKTLKQFLTKMTSDKQFAVTFTRSIFDAVELFQLSESGFSLHTSDSSFKLLLHGNPNRESKDAGIHIKQPYSGENSFQEYLTGPTKPVSQNGHALHFFSKRKIGYGTGLIIPRQGYVSIYSFSKQATEEEIHDFWGLIYQVYNKGRPDGKAWRGFGFHSGSYYGQTAAHVHARLEV